jgi:hypothetical protein
MPASKNDRSSGPSAYVAFLRGVNVGGNNMLPMKDLAAMFTKARCEAVQTYIASGNVVFRADAELAVRIPATIAKAITARTKLKIPVVVRSSRDLRRIAEGNPFLARGLDTASSRRVFSGQACGRYRDRARPQRSPPMNSSCVGRIYLYCRGRRSKLTRLLRLKLGD